MNKTHLVMSGRLDVAKNVLWNVLLDKVYHPEKYITDAKDINLQQVDENKHLRSMHRGSIKVQELIEIDNENMQTIFTLKDHNNYEGYILTRVEKDNDDLKDVGCYLTYEIHWTLKPQGNADPHIYDWFVKAYKSTVHSAII